MTKCIKPTRVIKLPSGKLKQLSCQKEATTQHVSFPGSGFRMSQDLCDEHAEEARR